MKKKESPKKEKPMPDWFGKLYSEIVYDCGLDSSMAIAFAKPAWKVYQKLKAEDMEEYRDTLFNAWSGGGIV